MGFTPVIAALGRLGYTGRPCLKSQNKQKKEKENNLFLYQKSRFQNYLCIKEKQ
jgi:hypothetical protein